jgi:hypothetical protein
MPARRTTSSVAFLTPIIASVEVISARIHEEYGNEQTNVRVIKPAHPRRTTAENPSSLLGDRLPHLRNLQPFFVVWKRYETVELRMTKYCLLSRPSSFWMDDVAMDSKPSIDSGDSSRSLFWGWPRHPNCDSVDDMR